jgi:hypothetical protein
MFNIPVNTQLNPAFAVLATTKLQITNGNVKNASVKISAFSNSGFVDA